MRRQCQFILLCTLLSEPVAAQQGVSPGTLCWRAQPIERCRTMILTNFGGYIVSGSQPLGGDGASVRAVADYGVLVNVGARSAVGMSLFASLSRNGDFVLGPAVRYRRWLGSRQSIDLALGTPLIGTADGSTPPPLAPYGLIKYNPAHWVGLALRPELRRNRFVNICNGNSCTDARHSRFVMSAGVEFGWRPGFAMTVVSGVVGLLVLRSIEN